MTRTNYHGLSAFPLLLGIVTSAGAADIGDYAANINYIIEKDIKPILSDSVLIDAIRQNNASTNDANSAIIERMDARWRFEAERLEHPLIDSVLKRKASARLRDIKHHSAGLFDEIILMDKYGRNAAISNITSDYWQGDEDKWRQTYLKGRGAIFVDKINHDASTGMIQVQVSLTIDDPTKKTPIGAITFGIDLRTLDEPATHQQNNAL